MPARQFSFKILKPLHYYLNSFQNHTRHRPSYPPSSRTFRYTTFFNAIHSLKRTLQLKNNHNHYIMLSWQLKPKPSHLHLPENSNTPKKKLPSKPHHNFHSKIRPPPNPSITKSHIYHKQYYVFFMLEIHPRTGHLFPRSQSSPHTCNIFISLQ